MTRTIVRLAVPAIASAALLTGCAPGPLWDQDSHEHLPTPTHIAHPDADESCTVNITTNDDNNGDGDEFPDRATITCGETSQEVAGQFRHRVTNTYDPATTGGIERVLIVGDERRVWMTHPDGSCLIVWSEGDDPTECKVSPRSDDADAADPSTPPDAPESQV